MAGVFVEVGSCDFDNYEVLLLDGWTGYFIEPVPEYLQSLSNRVYNLAQERNKKVKAYFINAAVSNFNGYGDVRYFPSGNIKWWAKGLGHICGYDNNGIETRLKTKESFIEDTRTISVPFLTLNDIISRYSIGQIDIMKIDVEGHELQVLECFDWNVKPVHIKIEHTFVGLQPLLNILEGQGYECFYDDEDVFGTLKNAT